MSSKIRFNKFRQKSLIADLESQQGQDIANSLQNNGLNTPVEEQTDIFSPYYIKADRNLTRMNVNKLKQSSTVNFTTYRNKSFDHDQPRSDNLKHYSQTLDQNGRFPKMRTPKRKKWSKFKKAMSLRKASKAFLSPLKKIKKMIPEAERTVRKTYFNKCPICNKNIEFLYKVYESKTNNNGIAMISRVVKGSITKELKQ
jgi:transcriptional regulator with AAA-type ATPase domain